MITKIKNKNQVTIPADIVKKLKLKINDQLQLEVINGRIVITPVEVIEKDFFETELGKEIKEALEEYRVEKAKGNIKTYDTVDEMFNDIGVEANE
ncbi:MAG TPA: AbrB/MazE/SpoVT family DNA-binding domain-containing protein [Bacillota bacterium]|nr:AbrB/MazE/SpoVT family DNA-binding domain-containing protein [Bacillota bacterium]